jgi:hypothetical protein
LKDVRLRYVDGGAETTAGASRRAHNKLGLFVATTEKIRKKLQIEVRRIHFSRRRLG